MSKTLSAVYWEVITQYSWGTYGKLGYKTRKEARNAMRAAKRNYDIGDCKLPDYIKSIKLFKVTHLAGLSALSEKGVYTYEEKR